MMHWQPEMSGDAGQFLASCLNEEQDAAASSTAKRTTDHQDGSLAQHYFSTTSKNAQKYSAYKEYVRWHHILLYLSFSRGSKAGFYLPRFSIAVLFYRE